MSPRASSVGAPARPYRAEVEIDADALVLRGDDGRYDRVPLDGATVEVGDSVYEDRFVRHAVIRGQERRCDLITPPDAGAIAPRAAGLRQVPEQAAILAVEAWQTVVDFLLAGGDIGGRTVGELARLARLAGADLAVALGKRAAVMAFEGWSRQDGPMRGGGGDPRSLLRPLEEAARESPRAGAALVAARAHEALLRSGW